MCILLDTNPIGHFFILFFISIIFSPQMLLIHVACDWAPMVAFFFSLFFLALG